MTASTNKPSRQALNFTTRRAEMEYNEPTSHVQHDLKVVVLARGKSRGYPFVILNVVGSHPAAYVGVPEGNKMFGLDRHKANTFDVTPHGGFTFASDEMPKSNVKGFWCLGWDYSHALMGDYSIAIDSGKKWTREEILAEVKTVIRQIDRV